MNLDWEPHEVVLVEELWNRGLPIEEIAKKTKRPVKEVFILIFDRAEQGRIEPRKGGIFGA